MSFTGFLVSFGYLLKAPAPSGGLNAGQAVAPIRGPATLSQLFAATAAGTTTSGAPHIPATGPQANLYIVAVSLATAVDAFYTIGPTPADPLTDTGARRVLFAGTDIDIFCSPGDKVRWAPAV